MCTYASNLSTSSARVVLASNRSARCRDVVAGCSIHECNFDAVSVLNRIPFVRIHGKLGLDGRQATGDIVVLNGAAKSFERRHGSDASE